MKKIKLTNRGYALVDNKDFDFINQFKWRSCEHGKHKDLVYAKRAEFKSGKWKDYSMHERIVGNAPKGKVIDHIDRNGLNNQKKEPSIRYGESKQNE